MKIKVAEVGKKKPGTSISMKKMGKLWKIKRIEGEINWKHNFYAHSQK